MTYRLRLASRFEQSSTPACRKIAIALTMSRCASAYLPSARAHQPGSINSSPSSGLFCIDSTRHKVSSFQRRTATLSFGASSEVIFRRFSR